MERAIYRIQDLLIEMMSNYKTSFYGYALQSLNIKPISAKVCPTMCASFTSKGLVVFYCEDFVKTLSDEHLKFVLIHELFHFVFDHNRRGMFLSDHELGNIAMDAVINTELELQGFKMPNQEKDAEEYGKKLPWDPSEKAFDYFVKYSTEVNKVTEEMAQLLTLTMFSNGDINKNITMKEWSLLKVGVLFDPEYKGDKFTEAYYSYLWEKKQKNPKEGSGKGKGPLGGATDHSHQELTEEELKEATEGTDLEGASAVTDDNDRTAMTSTMIEGAKQKSRGLMPGSFESMLSGLRKTKKNYIKEILSGLNYLQGNVKTGTYRRESRREIEGLRGTKKVSRKINVILDTSGSMCNEFDKCLSILFSRGVVFNLVQIDTKVTGVTEVHNDTELKKTVLKGGDGTIIAPAVDYIAERPQFNQYNTLILTDGYTDELPIHKLKRTLIISTEVIPPTTGKCRTIILEKGDI